MTATGFADLTGRHAVVTGASRGIGRAIAEELARGGADVVIHCRQSRDEAEKVAGRIRSAGGAATVVTADLNDERHLSDFVDQAWSCFGTVHIWVNNAGADLLTGPEAEWSYEEKLQRLLDIDVRGTMLLGRLAGQRMFEAGCGVLLNIGWDQSDRGMAGDSGELFAAAKNAIAGFSRSLAVSLAPKVRVNCIAPGWIRTAWGEQAADYWQDRVHAETPLKRWGTPQDIAALARFLVSSEADYMTGQVINANGGAVR